MAQQVWNIELNGTPHRIELEHGYWSGKRVIKVDGETVHHSQRLVDPGSRHRISVDNQVYTVEIKSRGFQYTYALSVGDNSDDTVAVDPASVRTRTRFKVFALGVSAFVFFIIGLAFVIMGDEAPPTADQLEQVTGTVEAIRERRQSYGGTLYIKVQGRSEEFSYESSQPYYSSIIRTLKENNSVGILTLREDSVSSSRRPIWQLSVNQRVLARFEQVLEAKAVRRSVDDALGLEFLLGSAITAFLAYGYRRLLNFPDSELAASGQRMKEDELAPVGRLLSASPTREISLVLVLIGLAWIAQSMVKAAEWLTSGLALWIWFAYVTPISLIIRAKLDSIQLLSRTKTIITIVDSIILIIGYGSIIWYFVPTSRLEPLFGDYATTTAVLIVMVSPPIIFFLMPAAAATLTYNQATRRLLVISLWLASMANIATVAVLADMTSSRPLWLGIGAVAVSLSLFASWLIIGATKDPEQARPPPSVHS